VTKRTSCSAHSHHSAPMDGKYSRYNKNYFIVVSGLDSHTCFLSLLSFYYLMTLPFYIVQFIVVCHHNIPLQVITNSLILFCMYTLVAFVQSPSDDNILHVYKYGCVDSLYEYLTLQQRYHANLHIWTCYLFLH
jgi:hypothetical protein